MSFYLYLNEHDHAQTWINGGSIPINPASTYRSMERAGIYTPDENLIHSSPVDLAKLTQLIDLAPGVQIKGLSLYSCYNNGEPVPTIENAAYYEDDGLILSFSYRLTKTLARRMKKKCCVKILDMDDLKNHIDEQLGVKSIAGPCKYTWGHQRNHFLKSDDDLWQEEYRLFWPLSKRVEVSIKPGTAELMCLW